MLAIDSREVMEHQSFLVETDIGATQKRSLMESRKSECTRVILFLCRDAGELVVD
jgi:hypothetical protein